MFDLEYLNELRAFEMERLLSYIPPGARVLEFGAGTGRQARFLADRGHDVVAVDLVQSNYADHLVFPVTQYDGQHIPLEDRSVDVIFSSNVLEHVENIPAIMKEFHRILRPGGFGVHAMPTPAWRFWTFMSGFANAFVAATQVPRDLASPPSNGNRWAGLRKNLKIMAASILPIGHGTSSEGISELYTFSRHAWLRMFEKHGFDVVRDDPIGIFYTGHMLFGSSLGYPRRETLSRSLGSATRIYVVRPRATT